MIRLNVFSLLAIGSWATVVAADVPREVTKAVADFTLGNPNLEIRIEDGLVKSASGKPFSNGANSRAAAESFLTRHVLAFGVKKADLRESETRSIMRGKFTAYLYEQRWNGIPVDRTRLVLLVREEPGHPLVLATAQTSLVPVTLPQAVLTADKAHAAVLAANPAMTNLKPATLVVHTRSGTARPAWFFWADNHPARDFEAWGYYVDAVTGGVLEKRPGKVHANISGVVTGNATPGALADEPGNEPVEMPVYGARVFVPGGGTTYTASDGTFELQNEGEDEVEVRVDLMGQWCMVQTQSNSPDVVRDEADVTPPGPINFFLNPDALETRTAQVNTMTHTTLNHDYLKGIIPEFTGVDSPILSRVNIDNSCNAFYTPGSSTLNYYTSEPGDQPHCPNTAYSAIIYHEYGHFVIDKSLGGQAAGDYHEGIADTQAAFLLNSPCMADGFFGLDQGCLRNIDEPDFIFPVPSNSVHTRGLAIAGSFWDMRTELVDCLGEEAGLALARELLYNQILVGPGVISGDAATALFTLDDNDANLSNGTPNYRSIQRGFAAHNLAGSPDLSLAEFDYPQGQPTSASPFAATMIQVDLLDGEAELVDQGSVRFHYSTDGGENFESVALPVGEMLPDGARFTANLPAADCLSRLQWYVSAETLNQGCPITDPPNAPANTYETLVATATETLAMDTFETDTGWSTEASVVDDPFEPGEQNMTEGGWERAVPSAVMNNPDDFAQSQPLGGFPSGTGLNAFVTGAEAATYAWDHDVDWGPVRLISPTYELAGADGFVRYARWFYNDDGDDVMLVEASNDGGANWVTVETVSGKTGWVEVEHTISDLFPTNGQVVFRFTVSDEPNNSVTEACVDEFNLTMFFCATADADGDADVDLADFGLFQTCFLRDGGAPAGELCASFDFDTDADVDIEDYRHFSTTVTGPQ